MEGAAVRVSLICFGEWKHPVLLDGQTVSIISHELAVAKTAQESLIQHQATRLAENLDVAFHGMEKAGAFDIDGRLAREWLKVPLNPNGRTNVKVSGRPGDRWIIDFSCTNSSAEAALYEKPFEYVHAHVLPFRLDNKRNGKRLRWWLFGENQPRLRSCLAKLERFIATPRVSKYRIFRLMNVALYRTLD